MSWAIRVKSKLAAQGTILNKRSRSKNLTINPLSDQWQELCCEALAVHIIAVLIIGGYASKRVFPVNAM
jgi:hypothetical protein